VQNEQALYRKNETDESVEWERQRAKVKRRQVVNLKKQFGALRTVQFEQVVLPVHVKISHHNLNLAAQPWQNVIADFLILGSSRHNPMIFPSVILSLRKASHCPAFEKTFDVLHVVVYLTHSGLPEERLSQYAEKANECDDWKRPNPDCSSKSLKIFRIYRHYVKRRRAKGDFGNH
jgi:hypothetical protein